MLLFLTTIQRKRSAFVGGRETLPNNKVEFIDPIVLWKNVAQLVPHKKVKLFSLILESAIKSKLKI